MPLLSNFMLPSRGGLPEEMEGLATNLKREGGGPDEDGGGGGGGGDWTPTPPTTPPAGTEPPAEGGPGPGGPGPGPDPEIPPDELPGDGPKAPQPMPEATATTPMGAGSLALPGSASTMGLRTPEFFSNRFVGGPMEEQMGRRQGPGIPGQPGSLAPGGPGGPGGPEVPMGGVGMPTDDMLRRIIERRTRRPQLVR